MAATFNPEKAMKTGNGWGVQTEGKVQEARRELMAAALDVDEGLPGVAPLQAVLNIFGDDLTEESRAAADEAIRRVADNAEPEWMDAARWAVFEIAGRRDEFTTDAVWALLERKGVAAPHEPRAMGAVMRWASKNACWIEATDRTSPSTRPEHHAYPNRVWRSLIKGKT